MLDVAFQILANYAILEWVFTIRKRYVHLRRDVIILPLWLTTQSHIILLTHGFYARKYRKICVRCHWVKLYEMLLQIMNLGGSSFYCYYDNSSNFHTILKNLFFRRGIEFLNLSSKMDHVRLVSYCIKTGFYSVWLT